MSLSISSASLKIKRLTTSAKIPDIAYTSDAGFDLYADEDVTLEREAWRAIKTGIAMEIPEGYVGLIWEKSGLAIKGGLKTLGGVIDASFRGEVMVGMMNHSGKPYVFKAGDKVAQMLIQKVEHPKFEVVDELDSTNRGDKGFGSSGK